MTLSISSKPVAWLLSTILVICLVGCKKDVALLDDGGQVVGKGVFEITASFPSPGHLVLDGKEYTGDWRATKVYESSMAKSRRLRSARAYRNYMIGNDAAQLKHGHASLIADDGSKIQCDYYYRHQSGTGSCDVDGRQLKLTVEQNG